MNTEYESFGQLLTIQNPFRESAKQEFSSDMSINQKVISAFKVLKKNLTWNGNYQLYGKDPAKIIKTGSGSNADLNFILISILKDFGLKAYPVVMRTRSTGILPISYPSIQKLETFIVAVLDPDTHKYIFLDSSMSIPTLNVLPLELTVAKARLFSDQEKEENKWINLITASDNGTVVQINATIEDGQIKGKRNVIYQGQHALEYQEKKLQEQETESTQENDKTDCVITQVKHQPSTDALNRIEESSDFTIRPTTAGERLYINPMLFPHITKNPFFQAERVLPIEFPYPFSFAMSTTITIPEGYVIEEIPQSKAFRTEDNQLQCRYVIQKGENKIVLSYLFSLKKFAFSSDQYKQLQDIWTNTVKKNQENIVLKKL